ncbi:carboxymuconolactone decarboxylase family protein [Haladaptatus sp. DJG-WS-42]|uniref:carboxymuconolactone decarboxylase family protein n=1 Tax=Haladaptatus sp. DJG-WS-42 TaxID=3120516 RepID=UPI0030CBFEDD
MARVPYLDFDNLSPDAAALVEETGLGPLHVFRALANNPAALATLTKSAGVLWTDAGLDTRGAEFVILTVARAVDSAYEWHQHAEIGLDAGLTTETIRAISTGATDALTPEDAALYEYVTAYVDGAVDDATHDQLATFFDDSAVVGIAMLAGEYLALSRTIDALDIEVEGEFIGWNIENLDTTA